MPPHWITNPFRHAHIDGYVLTVFRHLNIGPQHDNSFTEVENVFETFRGDGYVNQYSPPASTILAEYIMREDPKSRDVMLPEPDH